VLLHVDLTSCKLQGRRLLALQNSVRVPIAPFEGLGSPDAPAVKSGAERPLPALRCQAPRWARGWVGGAGVQQQQQEQELVTMDQLIPSVKHAGVS
jgi:hypothetical protein